MSQSSRCPIEPWTFSNYRHNLQLTTSCLSLLLGSGTIHSTKNLFNATKLTISYSNYLNKSWNFTAEIKENLIKVIIHNSVKFSWIGIPTCIVPRSNIKSNLTTWRWSELKIVKPNYDEFVFPKCILLNLSKSFNWSSFSLNTI